MGSCYFNEDLLILTLHTIGEIKMHFLCKTDIYVKVRQPINAMSFCVKEITLLYVKYVNTGRSKSKYILCAL